jgi:hypothetical protein
MPRLSLVILVTLCSVLPAYAAEQTVLGGSLLVQGGGAPAKRKIVVKAKETAADNTIVGNPVTSGATLTVSAGGATPTTQTFTLPAASWSGDAVKGFKYKDSKGTHGPVKAASVKRTSGAVFLIKAIVDGKLGAVSVVPPNTGTFGCAQLAIGGGDSYHVRFASGAVSNKSGAQFKVVKPTLQGSCTPCDFLDPAQCVYPFPSDYFTVADPTTDTGRRVRFTTGGMPKNTSGVPIEASDYNWNDGFSPGASILTYVPNVDLAMTGAAPITDIEQSQAPGAPIVVVNAATGARHSVWAEINSNATGAAGKVIIIHPTVNFDEGARYIVALRNLKDASGAVLAPNADFLAYRDGTPFTDTEKEARRTHMEGLFATLGSAGIPRGNLYLAWDFTVASSKSMTGRLLHMRDDAFSRLSGSAAPAFVVDAVYEHSCLPGQESPYYDNACASDADCTIPGPPASPGTCDLTTDGINARIFRRVVGTYQVDRYVDSPTPPARFVLDANGLPVRQSTPQPASFICNIPQAALSDDAGPAVPARASIYGHGLLGSNEEVSSGNVEAMANEHNFVFCATKWIGMSEDDVGTAISILQEFSKFPALTDRLQQGMLNQLALARLMISPAGFAADPAFQDDSGNPVIDPTGVFYDGNSQGGIFGGTVMAVAQEITRGVLGVPGMNYSLLLQRSTDFALYQAFLNPSYANELHPLVLALAQMLWDRSDPNGYARHITNDPLPNTPAHEVLLHLAFGDHQVANVATEIQARTIGASIAWPAITPGRHSDVNPYSGIPHIPSYPFYGSALVVWDSGAATPPITNTPPGIGFDPHSDPRKSPQARQQKSDFLQHVGGAVTDVCGGGPCVIPHY